MTRRHYITTETRQQRIDVLAMKGDDQTIEIDLSAWAEDNDDISSATWTVESGSAAVDGEVLADNMASARITTTDSGQSMIKVSATTGTVTKTVYIRVFAKDPTICYSASDYGLYV